MAREVWIGEGGESPVSFEFEALQRTATLLATPHLLAVMATLGDGRQPYAALRGVMPDQIDVAVQRLLEVGVARLVVDADQSNADGGRTISPVALTRKGRRVLELVRDLCEPTPDAPEYANRERALLPSEQVTER